MHQTDILVIGGGIAGTATACHLAQYGHQVTLLEQSKLAREASGLNAGTLWATGWGHTPDLSSTLSMGSLEVFKTLQLDLGYDLEFRHGGSLQAIQTEEEYAFARQEVRELLTRGHQVELLDERDERSIEPALSHFAGEICRSILMSRDDGTRIPAHPPSAVHPPFDQMVNTPMSR